MKFPMSEQELSSFNTWLAKVSGVLDFTLKTYFTSLVKYRGKLLGKLILLKDV